MGLVLEGTFTKKNRNEELIHLAMPTSPPSVFVEKIENPNSARSAMSGRSLQCFESDNAEKLVDIISSDGHEKLDSGYFE